MNIIDMYVLSFNTHEYMTYININEIYNSINISITFIILVVNLKMSKIKIYIF